MLEETQQQVLYVENITRDELAACRIPGRKLFSVRIGFRHAEAQFTAIHEKRLGHRDSPTISVYSKGASLNDFNYVISHVGSMLTQRNWGLTWQSSNGSEFNSRLILPYFSPVTPRAIANLVECIYEEKFRDVKIEKATFTDVPKRLINGTGFDHAKLSGLVSIV